MFVAIVDFVVCIVMFWSGVTVMRKLPEWDVRGWQGIALAIISLVALLGGAVLSCVTGYLLLVKLF